MGDINANHRGIYKSPFFFQNYQRFKWILQTTRMEGLSKFLGLASVQALYKYTLPDP